MLRGFGGADQEQLNLNESILVGFKVQHYVEYFVVYSRIESVKTFMVSFV